MAYSRPWPPNELIDTNLTVDQVNDKHASFAVDIRERMDSLLGPGVWTQDPIPLTIGPTAVTSIIPPHDVTITSSSGAVFVDRGLQGQFVGYIPVRVPVGATLQAIIAYFDYIQSPTVTVQFRKISITGFNQVSVLLGSGNQAGFANNANNFIGWAGSELVLPSFRYYFTVNTTMPSGYIVFTGGLIVYTANVNQRL